MMTPDQPRPSILAISALVISLVWYVIMVGAIVWYLRVPLDLQGWDGLIIVAPALYFWVPSSILGLLLGGIARYRINANPGRLKGRSYATAAVWLSLLSPLVGYGLIQWVGFRDLKTWI